MADDIPGVGSDPTGGQQPVDPKAYAQAVDAESQSLNSARDQIQQEDRQSNPFLKLDAQAKPEANPFLELDAQSKPNNPFLKLDAGDEADKGMSELYNAHVGDNRSVIEQWYKGMSPETMTSENIKPDGKGGYSQNGIPYPAISVEGSLPYTYSEGKRLLFGAPVPKELLDPITTGVQRAVALGKLTFGIGDEKENEEQYRNPSTTSTTHGVTEAALNSANENLSVGNLLILHGMGQVKAAADAGSLAAGIAHTAGSAYFLQLMTRGAANSYQNLKEVSADPKSTPAELAEARTKLLLDAGFASLAGYGVYSDLNPKKLESMPVPERIQSMSEASGRSPDEVLQDVSKAALTSAKEVASGQSENPFTEIDRKALPANAQVSIPKEGEIGTPTITIPGKEGGASRSPLLNEPAPEFHGSPEEAHAAGWDITKQETESGDLVGTDLSVEGMQKLIGDEMKKAETKDWGAQESEEPGTLAANGVEIPPESSDANTHGVARRILDQRTEEGNLEPIPPSKGNSAEDLVQHGEDRLAAGYDPNEAAARAKAGVPSTEDAVLIRAQARKLFQAAQETAEKFGDTSPEYLDAAKAERDWLNGPVAHVKLSGSEIMRSLQGERDLDTGDFHSVASEIQKVTKQDKLTAAQTEAVKTVTEKSAKAKSNADAKIEAFSDAINNETPKTKTPPGVAKYLKTAADSARERIRNRSAKLGANPFLDPTEVLGAAGDLAVIAAEHLAKGIDAGTALVKEFGDAIKPHLKDILEDAQKQFEAAHEVAIRSTLEKRKAALEKQIGAIKEKVQTGDISTAPKKATRPEIQEIETLQQEKEGWQEKLTSMRDNAAKVKDLEAAVAEKERKLAEGDLSTKGQLVNRPGSVEDIETLKQSRDALNEQLRKARAEAAKPTEAEVVQKKLDALNKAIVEKKAALASGDIDPKAREAAPVHPDLQKSMDERDALNEQLAGARNEARKQARDAAAKYDYSPAGIRDKIKQHWDAGEHDPATIFSKISLDSGMDVNEIYDRLTQSKSLKGVTDEMFKAMADSRDRKNAVQSFIQEQQVPGWTALAQTLPMAHFRLAVAGHSLVFGITHAGNLALNPSAWRYYWPNFFRQSKLMFDRGYHERMMGMLENDPLYEKAAGMGLDIRTHQTRDDILSAWAAKSTEKFGLKLGNGADALKLMRMEAFKAEWAKLPESMQNDNEFAENFVASINAATGSAQINAPAAVRLATFALKLKAAQWKWAVKDPLSAFGTVLRETVAKGYEKAGAEIPRAYQVSEAQHYMARRELIQKGFTLAGFAGLLAANHGLLSAFGSSQKINVTDPKQDDYLKFKGFGKQTTPVAPIIAIYKLIGNLGHINFGTRTNYEKRDNRFTESVKYAGQYARGQLSPAMGVATDLVTKSDLFGRPMPFSDEKVPANIRKQGQGKYTWGEYLATHFTMLPVEEALREGFKANGADETTANHWVNTIVNAGIGAGTGLRTTQDTHLVRDSSSLITEGDGATK